ncbi:MAG: sugar transferase, partial [Butyrivibrio sp.]|nr:sugar transferase [Butyrivibrio sp.]
MYRKYIKRVLDIILSLFVIVVFIWLYAILAILVRCKLGSHIIFKNARLGKDEKVFNMYKFRTMTDERDANGQLLPDEVRLTKFGNFLRRSSLDELPEMFNILKGDMSLIGPRPLLVKYLPYYTDRERLRHSIRPGLTGYAQAHGRNTITWEQKFEYDVWYVDNCSLCLDIKIIWMTVLNVLKRSDVGEGAGDMKNVDDVNLGQRVGEYRKKHN